MKLIATTTALNYADYLSASIASVVSEVDCLYVVTEFGDPAVDVASRHGAIPVLYDGWRDGGAGFNKSGAIRHAQSHAYAEHSDAWYLLIDADIVLPAGTRSLIERAATDEAALYCAERDDFHTASSLQARVPDAKHTIAVAGYFQLYRRHLLYAEHSHSAERCDLDFAAKFDRRVILPLAVAHLGKDNVNWRGRTSPQWS